MKTFLNRKVQFAFGLAMFTLLLMGSFSYHWVSRSEEDSIWVQHTYEVIQNIQDLQLTMRGIESGARGFALTGIEADLATYRTNVARAAQDETTLRTLTADNSAQQAHFPTIEILTAKRIESTDSIIAARRSGGLAAATAAQANRPDRQVRTDFQTALTEMQGEEERLLALRMAETDRDRRQTKEILVCGTLLGILIAGMAAWSAVRDSSKRALAEEALRQSDARYRMLLDGVPDYAIFMLDQLGTVASWSASAEQMKGYPAEEIIGRNFSCFFVPDDIERGRPKEILQLAAKNGRHEESGMRVRKDGSQFLAGITFVALHDSSGKLQGFSEISHALRDDRDSEAKYRGLLEAAPDGMVVVNQAGEIVLLNARAESQFGYRRDELLGQKVKSIIPEGFAERLIADGTRTAAEALAQQIGTGIELNGQRKDGSEFPIEMMLSPLESPEGILVTAAIRDITVRKNAEKHLAQMEGRYRGLLEAAPDGMVVVNQAGEIVLLNARAESQFGYRRDELLGQKVKSIIPEGFAERLIADALRTTAEALAQQIGTGIELNGQRKDGSSFPIEIMLSPLESAEGILVTAAIRDISERKQLARQLHQSQKMEAIGQLTGGIAHDFNNLLGVIIGNLDLLDRQVADNPAAVKRVNTAQKAAMRGSDITRRLLVFSSNEELKPSVVMLKDSIQNTIELAARGLGPEIKISTHIDGAGPQVFVDAAGLESALLNLVVNARDAMPKGGSIIIGSKVENLDVSHPAVLTGDLKPGHFVCVSVSDSGQGMSKETLERAFEPFFSTKPRNKGTGLGLAMVYGFVKQSGGTAHVYSELGHGTTVSLYLPVSADMLHAVPAAAPTALEARLGGTVLVVDDEEDLLEIALVYLHEMGFIAMQAKDGASAMEMIAEHGEIELMVTDIVMPGGMNGVELVQRALDLRPDLKIIYSSGFPAEALAERSMPLVDGPLLRKPYQRSEFAAIVHRVMESEYAALENN